MVMTINKKVKRNKILFLSGILFAVLFSSPLYGTASARDIEMIIRSVECQKDNKVLIRYSLINPRNYDYPNVSICFKITINEKPVACRELRVVIPKEADGSQVYETMMEAPCGTEKYNLRSMVLHNVKRYSIEEWFSGCPGSWESGGQDELKKAVYTNVSNN